MKNKHTIYSKTLTLEIYKIRIKNINLSKLTLFLILSFLHADDLIVDQNSLNQYEKDNYVLFDAFDFHGTFQGNMTGPGSNPSDRIYLPDSFPILGNQFTIETWVFSDGQDNNSLNARTIIGNDASPIGNDPNRPPMISFLYDHQIRYGFGTDSIGFRFRVDSVRTLINNQQSAGYKSVVWDATNDLGQPVSAGMYLYRISAGEFVQVKKMVLLK